MGYGSFRSGLEATRREHDRKMLGDTEILMYDHASTQGTPYKIRTSVNPSWKQGKLFLIPGRLLFLQGNSELFSIPIERIGKVYIVHKRWLGKSVTDQLCIEMPRHNPFNIAVRNAEAWKETIESLMEATEDGQSSGD